MIEYLEPKMMNPDRHPSGHRKKDFSLTYFTMRKSFER